MTHQLGVIPKFPARVAEGTGIRIDRANAVYTFALDFNSVPPSGVADPANTYVLVQNPDGTYSRVPLSQVMVALAPPEQTGKRNALINGGFAVWQRGVSFTGVSTTRAMTADRWGMKTGAGTLTSVTRLATGAASRSPYALQIQGAVGVTTVDVDQRIEAVNVTPLRGPVVFSVKINNQIGGPFTPTLFVSTPAATDNWTTPTVQNGGGAGEPLIACPPGITTVSWSADISGYANFSNGLEFRLRFPSGSLSATGQIIIATEIKVERVNTVGVGPSLFEIETFSDELARCQRYYQKTFTYNTAPVQNAGNASVLAFGQPVGASISCWYAYNLPVVMRAIPAVTLYNPAAVNSQMRNNSAATDFTATTASGGERSILIQATSPAASAVGQQDAIHLTADAEL